MRVSPDGQHVAYVAGGGVDPGSGPLLIFGMGKVRSQTIVRDDEEGPPFVYVRDAVFSPDGRRLAYRAEGGSHWESLGGSGSRWETVVVDGVQGPRYDVVAQPVFSADSSHVAYGACHGVNVRKRECVLIVDGVERATPAGTELIHDVYDPSNIVFSPDSSRLAYFASRDNVPVLVNGTEITPAPGSKRRFLTFSPDGRHLAYVRVDRHEQHLVVDGVEGPPHREVGRPAFGPDGRIAYPFWEGKLAFVDVQPDGERKGPYRSPFGWVGKGGLGGDGLFNVVFSPDGKRLAYRVMDGRKQFVVVDGLEGRRYDHVFFPSFSPDGSRVAFDARSGNEWHLVVDGVEGPLCASLEKTSFGRFPSSATAFAASDLMWCIVRNGDDIVRREVRIVGGARP